MMSNLEAATKVADQLVARLFDQRQFTGGEINYLMRELGERSNLEANFDKILKINENACLINDRNSGDMCQSSEPVAKDVCDKVGLLVEQTEKILSLEEANRIKSDQLVMEKRKELETKKADCLMECNTKLEKLKESIVQEELDLERKYLKFEENLRNK